MPDRAFEIVTFEIKKCDAMDVRGVFEALFHRQFATMSCVIFNTDGKPIQKESTDILRIRELARDHGVGVITATEISDYNQWEELVEARHNTFSPEYANSFIAASFSEASKQKILKWQK